MIFLSISIFTDLYFTVGNPPKLETRIIEYYLTNFEFDDH